MVLCHPSPGYSCTYRVLADGKSLSLGYQGLTACTHLLPDCFPACPSSCMSYPLSSSLVVFSLTDSTERHHCWQIISFLSVAFFLLCLPLPVLFLFILPSFILFILSYFTHTSSLVLSIIRPFSPLCVIK